MRFTVIGKSPAFTDAGGVCTSYLIEEGDYSLLIDCGNGAFGALRAKTDYLEINQILISHFHGDHVLDLVPFAYALIHGRAPGGTPSRLPLALPPGGATALRDLVSTWGSPALIDAVFDPTEYETGSRLTLGPLEVGLHEVPHFTLTHAVELLAPSGGRLVFGADCRPNEALERAASGAQVLVAEATLAEAADEPGPPERRGHMSAAEAGALAERAGVGRLVLTHFSDLLDAELLLGRASATFSGPVELAATGACWEL